MIKRIQILAAICLLSTVSARAEDISIPASWDARIVEVKGDVRVVLAKSSVDEAIKASKDMPLSAGDRVLTGKSSLAHVAISAESSLELGADSTLTVGSLRQKRSIFNLDIGYLVAKLKHIASRRFEVRTPNSVTAVRGTELGVEIIPGAEPKTVVGVFDEGQLAVSSLDGTGESLLNANEETDVISDQAPSPPRRLAFFLRREARLKSLRSRRAWLRKKFKKYSKANRDRIRKKMQSRRDKVRTKLQKKKKSIKKRGSRRRQELKQRRDRIKRGRKRR
jgi:hypothetical protein